MLLQSILERAVEWRRIDVNPVRGVRKPSQRRTRIVRRSPCRRFEAMREFLLQQDRLLVATPVSTLAYAGLRPAEAIGLRWNDITRRTLLVERSVAFGQLKSTKTGTARTVRVLAPVAEDFAAWQRVSRRAAPTISCFPPLTGHPGTPIAPATGARAPFPTRRAQPVWRWPALMTCATAS